MRNNPRAVRSVCFPLHLVLRILRLLMVAGIMEVVITAGAEVVTTVSVITVVITISVITASLATTGGAVTAPVGSGTAEHITVQTAIGDGVPIGTNGCAQSTERWHRKILGKRGCSIQPNRLLVEAPLISRGPWIYEDACPGPIEEAPYFVRE
jgi:hypothetical protein